MEKRNDVSELYPVLNWVAAVARRLPGAEFLGASGPITGGHAVSVRYNGAVQAYVVGHDSPESVAEGMIGPFDPPAEIKCPTCSGNLKIDRPNTIGTKMFVDCHGICQCCYQIPMSVVNKE